MPNPERRWPKATLICRECGYTARRKLMLEAGCRGHRETATEPALCPNGHGILYRKDGLPQERWAWWAELARFVRSA